MQPEEYFTRLTEITLKKYYLLEEILRMTKAQSETIREDGIDELGALIAGKQERIDRIDKLDEQFEVYFKRLKQELGINNLAEAGGENLPGAKELQDVTGKVLGLLNEINAVEKSNNQKTVNLLNLFKSEIKSLNQAKKVNSAYHPVAATETPAYFINKKR
ncbi:MAG TPA: flagellar export chaperone FlgN [Clostridia bacterium]